MNKLYKEAKINMAFKALLPGVVNNSDTYLLDIIAKEEENSISEYIQVTFRRTNLWDQLNDLFGGERERVYASFGMQNVDFYLSCGDVMMEWSPCDGEVSIFVFSEENFKTKFMDLLY